MNCLVLYVRNHGTHNYGVRARGQKDTCVLYDMTLRHGFTFVRSNGFHLNFSASSKVIT